MIPHLLRCQGLAVDYYGFALGRLESGASSTFAPLGLYLLRKFPEGVVFHGDDRTKGRKYQTGIEMDFRQSIG